MWLGCLLSLQKGFWLLAAKAPGQPKGYTLTLYTISGPYVSQWPESAPWEERTEVTGREETWWLCPSMHLQRLGNVESAHPE